MLKINANLLQALKTYQTLVLEIVKASTFTQTIASGCTWPFLPYPGPYSNCLLKLTGRVHCSALLPMYHTNV